MSRMAIQISGDYKTFQRGIAMAKSEKRQGIFSATSKTWIVEGDAPVLSINGQTLREGDAGYEAALRKHCGWTIVSRNV
jgi:hypothetical protein